MDNISKKLDTLKTRGDLRRMSESGNAQSEQRETERDRLWPLWEAMASTWGSFVSLYGEEPTPGWAVALRDYTDDQLYAGYEKARDDNLEFPPNLSRFLDYLSPSTDWEHRRIERADRGEYVDLGEGRLLPAPVDDRTPEEHLAYMRSLFQ